MEILAAIGLVNKLMDVVSNVTSHANAISAVVAKAQAEGRTKLTAEEWAAATKMDDDARVLLADAITKAGG